MLNIAVLVSGGGTNLQALIDSQLVEHRPRNRTMRLHERIRHEALRAAKALREENEPPHQMIW